MKCVVIFVFAALIAVSYADFAADIKPMMKLVKPACVAVKKGCKAAATNVKAAVQNGGAACQQMANGGAKICADGTVGAGKTFADAPKRFYQLIKQLEKKGPIATALKILFGPPSKSKKGKKGKGKKGSKGSKSSKAMPAMQAGPPMAGPPMAGPPKGSSS